MNQNQVYEVHEIEKIGNVGSEILKLRHQEGTLADEIESKGRNVAQLRKMLGDYDKENIVENRF